MPGDTEFLTLSEILEIAEGVLPKVLVRDLGLIESAAARPQTTVFGDLAYPTLYIQAAALLHSLARNYPLIDGNKRLAWASARVFLLLNGVDMNYDIDAAEELVLEAARGECGVKVIAQSLKAWSTH